MERRWVAAVMRKIILAAGMNGLLTAATAQQPPNILVIIADDLRPAIGACGDPVALTPNLDRFAKEGTVFQKAYANFPVCGPSRASFLSGKRPETSGVVTNGPEPIRELIPGVVTLPEVFKKNGYQTIGMGKIFHENQDGKSWTKFFHYPQNITGYQEHRGAAKGPAMEFSDRPESRYPDGWQADTACHWLENAPARPFLMMVGLQKPHLPFVAPKKYWDLYEGKVLPEPGNTKPPVGAPPFAGQNSYELRMGFDDIPQGDASFSTELQSNLRRGYYACVSFEDAQIGRILETLEHTGLDKSTAVFIVGDNGFHLQENGFWCKDDVFETAAHVAMLGRFPMFHAVSSVTEPVELVDLYPTLCSLAGIVPPYLLDGTDLVPLLKGGKLADETAVAFTVVNRNGRMIGLSLRDKNFRYTMWRDKDTGEPGGEELYDYSLVLPEEQNLVNAERYAGEAARLRAIVKKRYEQSTLRVKN